MNLAPTRYVVKSGDNLTRIAQQQGYADWKLIYGAPCNQDLRRKRPDANRIQPGDVIMLPPRPADIRNALQDRLKHLEQIKRETGQMFDQLSGELDQSFKKWDSDAFAVDIVSHVLTGLATITLKGAKALKLSGDALAKANNELAKDALKFAYKPLVKAVAKAYKDGKQSTETQEVGDGVSWSFGGALQTVLDMTSPSYWAYAVSELKDSGSVKRATMRRPKDIHQDAKNHLSRTRQNTIAQIDQKIAETRAALSKVGGTINVPLPL